MKHDFAIQVRFKRAIVATVVIGIVSVGAAGCKKEEPEWKHRTFKKVDLSRSAPQTPLPRSLWEKISGLVHHAAPDAPAESEEHGEDKKTSSGSGGPLPSVFAPLRVYFIERNKGILSGGDTQVQFSGGGGELDLADYVNPKSGSFYVAFEFLPDIEEVKRHVFFLSGATQRKLGNETVGAGCNSYFEVSSAFAKAMAGKGILVNTSDGRHASALVGSYFFAAVHEGKLFLAALKIKDSAHKQLYCQR